MEKTTHAHIASSNFLCTEAAYSRLASYLEQLKDHFASETDSIEIIRDIEYRIAEKLTERQLEIVTLADADAVIAAIGEVTDFADETENSTATTSVKRLYRDTDDAVLAGVSSGIAQYLAIDPLIIRLLFVISIFFGGLGVMAYVILWIAVPAAKTSTQKLEMRGKSVTLENISEFVKEQVAAGRDSSFIKNGAARAQSAFPAFLRFIGKGVGLLLAIGTLLAAAALTTLLGAAFIGFDTFTTSAPFFASFTSLFLIVTLIVGYVVALLPLILLFLLGYWLFRGVTLVSAKVVGILTGLWVVLLIAFGITGAKIASDYYTYQSANPAFNESAEEVSVAPFQNITVRGDDARIEIRTGATYSVNVIGTQSGRQGIAVDSSNGTLTIVADKRDTEECFLCIETEPVISITAPTLSELNLSDAIVDLQSISGSSLAITANDVYLQGNIILDALTITGDDVNARLSGTASAVALTLTDSYFRGADFTAGVADIKATDSNIVLSAGQIVRQQIDRDSTFRNTAAR